MRATLINALIICFSVSIVGCFTLGGNKDTWPLPPQPKKKPVDIVMTEDVKTNAVGFYMTYESANNLTYSVDELKGYSQKLELLVSKMAEYYNAKLEEVKSSEK